MCLTVCGFQAYGGAAGGSAAATVAGRAAAPGAAPGAAGGVKETPQERLKRIMAAQLNKQAQKDNIQATQKKLQVGAVGRGHEVEEAAQGKRSLAAAS